MSTFLGLIVMLLLVAATGLFVAIEFALLAADRARLHARAEEGSRPARLVLVALKRLSFYLAGAQLGITVTSLVLGFLAEPLVGDLIDPVVEALGGTEGSTLSVVLALFLATVFSMVVGELIPKNLAIAKPEAVALAVTPIVTVIFTVLGPFVRLFNGVADWAVRRLGVEPQEELAAVRSLEELEYLIRASGDSGSLRAEELNLLKRTLRFGEKTAAEALTPRVHLEAVPVTGVVGEVHDLALATGHSHYPIYGEDLDDIRGVISVTALFGLPIGVRRTEPVATLMTEAHVVPETRSLLDVLDDFRTLEAELFVVIDEHGGTAGVITLEDVLEEITGDIDDEYDVEAPLTVVRRGVFVVAGTRTSDEVADASGFDMPEGDYETIAGFMLAELGHIPAAGEQVSAGGWTLEVVEMDRHRIASVQLVAPDDPATAKSVDRVVTR
ncbi:MAG: hemolysin family protein [Actinomycetota bacterium]|nr:hemolysin family protein [Actinomycetota bacterium]